MHWSDYALSETPEVIPRWVSQVRLISLLSSLFWKSLHAQAILNSNAALFRNLSFIYACKLDAHVLHDQNACESESSL